MTGLDQFIHLHSDKLEQKDFDQSYKIWSGFDIVAQMNCIGLGPVKYPEAKVCLGSQKLKELFKPFTQA